MLTFFGHACRCGVHCCHLLFIIENQSFSEEEDERGGPEGDKNINEAKIAVVVRKMTIVHNTTTMLSKFKKLMWAVTMTCTSIRCKK